MAEVNGNRPDLTPGFVNSKNRDGDTPLHRAAHFGSRAFCISLVEAGADSALRNNDGRTAMQVARAANHIQTAQYLDQQARYAGEFCSSLIIRDTYS